MIITTSSRVTESLENEGSWFNRGITSGICGPQQAVFGQVAGPIWGCAFGDQGGLGLG